MLKRATLAVVLAVPSVCLGWGADGHKISVQIATHYLDAKARAEVKALLGDQTLVDIAIWADAVRKEPAYKWTDSFHGVRIPPGAKGFEMARDCRDGNCAVSAIERFTATLRNKRATLDERREALKFLVHFVTDIHCPVHASYPQNKGGGDTKVFFFDQNTNLHKVWDSMLIGRAKKPWRQYAKDLCSGITVKQHEDWAKDMNPADWATESYRLAVSNAHPIPKDGHLGQEYFDRNLPVVNERLSMGGVRLAVLLNQIFADSKAPATMPSSNESRKEPAHAPVNP